MKDEPDTQQSIRDLSVLVEHVIDQNQAVLEAVSDMQKSVNKIPKIEADISELKDDIKIIKTVVTDTNRQVQAHERRITQLEAA